MEIDLPEGEDAWNVKGSMEGDLIEEEVQAAIERGETEFTIPLEVSYIDGVGEIHTETQIIEISAESVQDFWDQYYDDLEAIIDGLPADYEDAAVTG